MHNKRIFFEKPNFDLLKSLDIQSVDMHFHTRFSDCYTKISSILKKTKKLKIGVAITDHNTIRGYQKAHTNNQTNKDKILIIPGIEVTCQEGPHILLYFYNKSELEEFYNKYIVKNKQANPYMAINLKLIDLIEYTKNYNCLRVAAHPYGYYLTNCGLSKFVKNKYISESIFEKIDGLEILCGAMNRRLNKKAVQKAIELKKGITGGSDGHTIFELGKVVTCNNAYDIDGFLDSIKKKKNIIIGTETKLFPKLLPSTQMLSKHCRYAIPSIRMQYKLQSGRVSHMRNRIINKTISKTNTIKTKIKNITYK